MRHTSLFLRSLSSALCLTWSALPLVAEDEIMGESMEMEPMMGEMMDTMQSAGDPHVVLFEAAHNVLNNYCFECHGATKQKGDYRLDLKSTIYTPGESEAPPIVAGKPDESELFFRMALPMDDDDVMPPKKKARPSPADIKAVKDWITAGAIWTDDADRRGLPTTYVEIGDDATNALIDAINTTRAKAEYNAWGDNSVRVDMSVSDKDKLKDTIKALEDFGDRLAWLDCGYLELKSSFYKDLPQYTNLQRLHLDYSNVKDDDLKSLSELPKLNYLNLYSTEITDEGIDHLKACKSLEKVFLMETKVTKEGVAQLKAANPQLIVIHR